MATDTNSSSLDKTNISFQSTLSKGLDTSVYSPKDQEKHMAPLFYFLASSLNVELVYIILKSLTQFVNINPMQESYNANKRVQITKDVMSNDVTIELSKIKIKNLKDWSPAKGADLY